MVIGTDICDVYGHGTRSRHRYVALDCQGMTNDQIQSKDFIISQDFKLFGFSSASKYGTWMPEDRIKVYGASF